MADLGVLNPNAAVVDTLNDWAVGTFADIDEPIASADAAAVGDDSNVNGNPTGRYALANVPTDLGTVDTIAANVRYRVIGAQTNTRGLFARIVTDESIPTNLTDEVTVNAAVSNTAFANSGALTFTIQGTPTKAQWDNAVIALRLNVAKSMAGDTNGIRVDSVDVTGTYTTGAAEFNGTGSAGLVLSASGTGNYEPAVYNGTGSASLTLSASAQGHTVYEGSGSASLVFTASGTGNFAGAGFNGQGSASLVLTATGSGDYEPAVFSGSGSASLVLTATGTGDAGVPSFDGQGSAGLVLSATGTGQFVPAGFNGQGSANLVISASGTGAFDATWNGTGSALLDLTASGTGNYEAAVYTGAGTANLVLTATGTGSIPSGRLRTEGRSVSGFGWEGTPSGIGLEGTRL